MQEKKVFESTRLSPIPTDDITNCPVCQANSFKTYTVGYDYEYLTCSNEWRLVECAACSHVWLNPRPTIKSLPIIYPKSYYSYTYEDEINPVAVKGKEILDNLKFKGILRHLGAKPDSFVDVGCGTGRFLHLMAKKGLAKDKIYGIELDESIVKDLIPSGYTIIPKRVEDCDTIPTHSIDLITMFHVIEHVDDPATVIDQFSEWLSPNGILAMETPNINSFDAKLFKNKYWGGHHIPRHWNLFRPETITQLLASKGFEVIDIQYQTGHYFWMQSFYNYLRYKRSLKSLAAIFNPFKSVIPLAMFTAFDKIRAFLGVKTSAMLVIARKAT